MRKKLKTNPRWPEQGYHKAVFMGKFSTPVENTNKKFQGVE